MIAEWQTNCLYFSDLLPKKFSNIFVELKEILLKEKINFGFLTNTKDIWCRDYMPVQISENKFIQFCFNPDYLQHYENLKTDPLKILKNMKINYEYSNLIIDGGNIVYSEDSVILTDKIFKENMLKDEIILDKLKNILNVKNIFIIPKQPYDIYGHSDGMIRFINNKEVILNDFSKESKSFQQKLEKFLNKLPFKIHKLEIEVSHKLSWCYINFICIKNIIIIPVLNIKDEEKVLYQFEKLFKDYKIYTINCKNLLLQGGGLHCVSWNVLK